MSLRSSATSPPGRNPTIDDRRELVDQWRSRLERHFGIDAAAIGQIGGGRNKPTGVIEVPEALAGPGTRGARLGAHGSRAARRAKGLEGILVDRDRAAIRALDPSDARVVDMWIAGPGALLVAKTHKIAERVGSIDRVRDKDALDVLRLLRAIETDDLTGRLANLRDSRLAGAVTNEAIGLLPTLFGKPSAEGVRWQPEAFQLPTGVWSGSGTRAERRPAPPCWRSEALQSDRSCAAI